MIFFSFFHLFVRFCFLFFEMPVSFFIVSWAQRHLFIQLGSFLFGECFKISINSCIVLYVLCSNDGINGKNRRWSQWFFIFNLFCCGLLYFWFCLCFLQWVNSTNEMLIHNKKKIALKLRGEPFCSRYFLDLLHFNLMAMMTFQFQIVIKHHCLKMSDCRKL